jgi:NAD(P)-dependent dehydrogenase (short-subunit alcohol dehydrogenase family)
MSSPEPFAEHAVVVGASGSLGSHIVDTLIGAGKHVLGIARSHDSLAALTAKHASGFTPLVADLGVDNSIDIVRSALSRPVAMVVHAPGVPVAGGIASADPSLLIEACNIKVGGFVRLVRAAEPMLRAKSRLVAIGGHYGFEPTAYAATAGVANAALANVVRQISWAYGPKGITAHLVAPGPADTERLHRVAETRAASSGMTVDDVLAEMRSESAIGALVEPAQVAWAVRLLLDPEADALAGSSLMLDAGRRRGLP